MTDARRRVRRAWQLPSYNTQVDQPQSRRTRVPVYLNSTVACKSVADIRLTKGNQMRAGLWSGVAATFYRGPAGSGARLVTLGDI